MAFAMPLELDSTSLGSASWLRIALGHRLTNGLAVGFGLGLLSALVFWLAGPQAAALTSVGMLIVSIGDQTAPAHGKLRQLAPLLWLAAPMSLAMQLAHLAPRYSVELIGALVCLGGFIGMLGTAWGARGAPLGFALLLTMVFAMSTLPPPHWRAALAHAAWFEFGALLYAGYAVLSAHWLNNRYRAQALADALAELAIMLRRQVDGRADIDDRRQSRLPALLDSQVAMAERLQMARDMVLDNPRTPGQQRLVGMLIAAIRLREQALAFELELDRRAAHGTPLSAEQARQLETVWRNLAESVEQVCWSLFTAGAVRAHSAARFDTHRDRTPAPLPPELREADAAMTFEVQRLLRLASPDANAELFWDANEPQHWPLFRTGSRWTLAPLKRALNGHSLVLRYALRVTIALAAGYTIAQYLPWSPHAHWILLTIAVVMRTNLAQTLERRNARVLGTLIGCILVGALLSLQPSVLLQFALLALATGVTHGFVQVRYLVAAAGATVLALLQGHLLHTAGEFALLERLADTLIGTAIAWAFSYVLPAWERRQLPALLKRLSSAQIQHASIALIGDDLATGNTDWRLARREVLDSLAALATAAQRAHAEPRAVQPPFELIERLQLRSYRLIAQLGGVRSWREQRRGHATDHAAPQLVASLTEIRAALESPAHANRSRQDRPDRVRVLTETVSFEELSGALHQRLRDAVIEARALGIDLAATQAWEMERRRGER
ncbi:MAG: FUSC family protein [Burkholderiaceae bacterium]